MEILELRREKIKQKKKTEQEIQEYSKKFIEILRERLDILAQKFGSTFILRIEEKGNGFLIFPVQYKSGKSNSSMYFPEITYHIGNIRKTTGDLKLFIRSVEKHIRRFNLIKRKLALRFQGPTRAHVVLDLSTRYTDI